MSLADDLHAEAEALLKLAAARDTHTASVNRETASVEARGQAGSVAKKSATTPGFTPYTGSGTPAGDYQFHGYTGSGTPAGDPNDGPGVSGGHTTSGFKGGGPTLSAFNHAELTAGVDWVEAHCFLTSIKIPDPSVRFGDLAEVPMVDLPVWDCRAAMKNADALFVPAGAWDALAKSSSKVNPGSAGGGEGGGAGGGGIKASPPTGPLFSSPNDPVVGPAPTTTQGGGGKIIIVQAPTAPTPGDAAIVRVLQVQSLALERIARATEAGASTDNLTFRRGARL